MPGAREERIKTEKDISRRLIEIIIEELNQMELADGIDKNSWLFAGCIQDLKAAQTRINDYIERCLK